MNLCKTCHWWCKAIGEKGFGALNFATIKTILENEVPKLRGNNAIRKDS